MKSKYTRVLLKLSGEQFQGKNDNGISTDFLQWLAKEIAKAKDTGVELIIMAGGGNLVRGAELAGNGIRRVTADQMGMMSGLMNAVALTDVLEDNGIKTRCLSNLIAPQVAETFVHRLANKHLEKNRVVVIAGGIGRPYFTHDTAAVNLALELNCDLVLKATKVDGIYDKDPNKFDDAVKITKMTLEEAADNKQVRVMDKAALALAYEYDVPLIVFDLLTEGNIAAVLRGETVGTHVS